MDICRAYAICSSSVMRLKSGRAGVDESVWGADIFSRACSDSATKHRQKNEHSNHISTEILCMEIVWMNILLTISSRSRQASFRSWRNSCPASLILLSLSLLLHWNSQSLKRKKMNMLDEMAAWMNLGKSDARGYEMLLVKLEHKYTIYTLVVI